MKHTAKFFSWVEGVLKATEKEFKTLEAALESRLQTEYENVKIYDNRGVCVHSSSYYNYKTNHKRKEREHERDRDDDHHPYA